ncbi:hypothetical protein IKQ19_14735, partial [Candidatus Saccharibacteria bacterium]|nr:hypothetical protein [Candidatus Saccharibacteria bacterium]
KRKKYEEALLNGEELSDSEKNELWKIKRSEETEKSRQKTAKANDLKKKSKVVKDAIEFFNQDYDMMKSVLQEYCDEILKLLAQSENEIARGRVIHQKDLFESLEKIL